MSESRPIVLTEVQYTGRVEKERSWTYEELLDLYGERDVVGQLVKRCQEYEEKIEKFENNISVHWYDGDTYNGQPMNTKIKSLCGLPRVVGACHMYQITCDECKKEVNKRIDRKSPN